MPSPWPAFSWNVISCTTSLFVPGGTMLTVSSAREWAGVGRAKRGGSGGDLGHEIIEALPALPRRDEALQCVMASSTGASARAVRIALAMMMPAVAC